MPPDVEHANPTLRFYDAPMKALIREGLQWLLAQCAHFTATGKYHDASFAAIEETELPLTMQGMLVAPSAGSGASQPAQGQGTAGMQQLQQLTEYIVRLDT